MYKGPIVDAHMHLWDRKNPGYEWLKRTEPTFGFGKNDHDFLVNDYLDMVKDYNVVAGVHVECYGFPDDPVKETAWIQQQADETGWPHAITAKIVLDAKDVEAQMERHCEYPLMRATRTNLNNSPGYINFCERADMMQDKAWLHGYGLLKKYNIMYEMQCYDTQLDQAYELAKQHEQTPMIINHLGWPVDVSNDGFKPWQQRIAHIAQLPNVYFKLSCIGSLFMKNDPDWIIPFIQSGIETFGVDRCLFASNCPPDDVHIPFNDLYRIFKMSVRDYSPDEQRQLFFTNAKRLYRIDIDETL